VVGIRALRPRNSIRTSTQPAGMSCLLRGGVRYSGEACKPPGVGRAEQACPSAKSSIEGGFVGSVIKKRRKRMAKKKHRKLLRKTRVQRRNKK
jgi:mRNA-processing protein COX24